jgi:hypothetical protein
VILERSGDVVNCEANRDPGRTSYSHQRRIERGGSGVSVYE